MFVCSEYLSVMFKLDSNIIFSLREFQPYVILEDILDRKFNSDLNAKEIKVSGVQGRTKLVQYEQEIPTIENVKTEIKEEECSEHIEDIASSENGNLYSPREQVLTTFENQVFESVELQSPSGVANERLLSDKRENKNLLHKVLPSRDDIFVLEDSEDGSSLDLHLSPDSTESENEDVIGCSKNRPESSSENVNFSQNKPPLQSYVSSSDTTSSSEGNPPAQQYSPGQFQQSPDGTGSTLTGRPSRTCPSVSSDLSHTGEDNREPQEEWNSQEIIQVSRRLRRRSRQAKRLIQEVIRKRQMADETLEAFKKRLRRM